MPSNLKGGKVFNISSKESKDTIIIDYLLYLTYEGEFQTNYNEGDLFNPAGLKLIAHLADGSTRELTMSDSVEWKYFPITPLKSDTKYITCYYSYYDKTATCQIPIQVTKIYIDPPRILEDSFTYDGQVQFPTIVDYDSNFVVLSGDLSGITAGNYEITATITDPKYQFPEPYEGQTMTINWTIEKAIRPLSLSQDYINYDENSKINEYSTITLNYPGNVRYRHSYVGGLKGAFNFIWDDATVNNSKQFQVRAQTLTQNVRQECEIWIEADDNYLESEHVIFTAFISAWEWGSETGEAGDVMDDDWIIGLMDQVRLKGAQEEWIGKTKVLRLQAGEFNYNNAASQFPVTCIDINKDAHNSVTFAATYASIETYQFNYTEDREWPYETSEDDPQWGTGEWMSDLQFYVFSNKYLLPKDLPALDYLVPMKKVYWTGEEAKVYENTLMIPSAAELGITADAINTYIGGQGIEYTEGVRTPYAYFIDASRRIKRQYNTNTPVSYWTRSTADNGNKAAGTNINTDQIIIKEDGTPDVLNKTTPANGKNSPHALFVFCYGLGGEDTYNV